MVLRSWCTRKGQAVAVRGVRPNSTRTACRTMNGGLIQCYQWGQMAVLYPWHKIGKQFEEILAKYDVPVDVAKDHHNHVEAGRDAVRFLSMHNAKGLEFTCVAIGGLGS